MIRLVSLLAGGATVLLFAVPPVSQDPLYHHFVDSRTLYAVPHFWNVFSNLAFLIVALYGLGALRSRTAFIYSWERSAYIILLIGTTSVAFGSAYYHYNPDDQRLFWDRLPMTIVFTSLIAAVVGERISSEAGKRLLWPLIALGIASVLVWRFTGDLRLYGLVQFGAMLALPVIIARYPPRYTHDKGIWFTGLFYVIAKLLESFDGPIGSALATGGHPWKHLAGGIAMFFYVHSVIRRRPLIVAESQLDFPLPV